MYLRQGRYLLTQTLAFGPEDSGTTYRAFPGETVMISGGQAVTGWERVKDDLWSAPVHAVGWTPRLLCVNGEPRGCARWPAEGFFTGLDATDGKTLFFPEDRFPEFSDGSELVVSVEWTATVQLLDRAKITERVAAFPEVVLPIVTQPWAGVFAEKRDEIPLLLPQPAGCAAGAGHVAI